MLALFHAQIHVIVYDFVANRRWRDFELKDMSLEYHAAAIYKKSSRQGNIYESEESNDTILVAFEINLGPNERPFLCQWTWSLHDPPVVLMLSRSW